MASLTVYATASDGTIQSPSEADWDDCHDAANGSWIGDTQTYMPILTYWSGTVYQCFRAFTYFDTSPLGPTAIISNAVVSLFKDTVNPPAEHNVGSCDVGIVEGVQDDPLEFNDYGDHLLKTTLGTDVYVEYPHGAGYNAFTLNDTGIGWINKTGITKFCFRLKGDIEDDVPTGLNRTYWFSSEKGGDFRPKLEITYTIPPPGWTGKISGVTNPAKIMGVDVANIAKVKGVVSG